jgi:hypothetical protein
LTALKHEGDALGIESQLLPGGASEKVVQLFVGDPQGVGGQLGEVFAVSVTKETSEVSAKGVALS